MIITNASSDLYNEFISLLQDVKLTQGPLAVTSTLKRHPKIKQFILKYQTDLISSLEKDLKTE